MDLKNKKCIPCEGTEKPFDDQKIAQYRAFLQFDWDIIDGKQIEHEFEFKDFKEAMTFVNKVANIAEEEGHHPDIYIFYNKVKIQLSTHAIKGLSENDFIMAVKIELI
jgi:4a-hydroxytetrahydrobiopterin dehydratase